MHVLETIFLGTIQGLTEFLPISSSGHLVIFQNLLGFKEPEILLNCALHLGTLLAVCSELDSSSPDQAMPWTEFLVELVKSNPGADILIGLSNMPSLSNITEDKFMAVKAVMDLLAAGVRLFQLESPIIGQWQLLASTGTTECISIVVMDGSLPLSSKLDKQEIV